MKSKISFQLTDELIHEFIEENKELLVDPEQYPQVFEFMFMSFLYQKGLLNDN